MTRMPTLTFSGEKKNETQRVHIRIIILCLYVEWENIYRYIYHNIM